MKVVIIGAGMSGLAMGMALQKHGFSDFVILEKAAGPGGTWRHNVYPGVACDIPSHLYAFAGEPNPNWSSRFPAGAEIRGYVERVAKRRRLDAHLRFGADVVATDWTGHGWTLTLADGTTVAADAVVAATGTLHHPLMPRIDGLSTFAGPMVHTARWRDDLMLAGRDVGVIGTGASAAQIVPELAKIARTLTVFQRTPTWVLAVPNRRYPAWLRWLLRQAPSLLRGAHRLGSAILARTYGGSFVGRSRWVRRAIEHQCQRALRAVGDPELRRRLTPDFAPGCKRLVFSDRYYRALQLPHVSVVTEPIANVAPEGIVTKDGQLRHLDALVLATGFETHRYLRPMRLTGLDGVSLEQLWADRPVAYRSIGLPGMPNFFLMIGPHSPIANLSVVKVAEWQAAYIARCLDHARRHRVALSPRRAATDREMGRIDAAAGETVWSGGCKSWYLDPTGRLSLYTMPPWTYRAELAVGPTLEDFDIRPLENPYVVATNLESIGKAL